MEFPSAHANARATSREHELRASAGLTAAYVRSATLKLSVGNEAEIRIEYTKSATTKMRFVVEERADDGKWGILTIEDVAGNRLKVNDPTIDETTNDSQGVLGFYPFRVHPTTKEIAVAVKGEGGAGPFPADLVRITAVEVLTT